MTTSTFQRRYLVIGLCGLLAGGCRSKVDLPDLGGLYSEAAQTVGPGRNPVIVIPGILGSRLVDSQSDRVAWGAFAGDYANPETDDGAQLAALPMQQGQPLRQLIDGVVSDGALDRLKVRLLLLSIEQEAYLQILGTLGVGGYRDELLGEAGAIDYGDDHFTCFQFDYDWRRDNVENAQRLSQFIQEKRAYVQEELKRRYGTDTEVKFDIVAHSMGGLITRYFLRFGDADLPADGSVPPTTWAGAQHVERAVLVGTPSAGSVMALKQLVERVQFAPVLPRYGPALLGTFPSIYQLLPRTRHLPVVSAEDPSRSMGDLYDVNLWKRYGWGLANPKLDDMLNVLLPDVRRADERCAIALDHLEKCLERARQFAASIDTPAEPPHGLQLFLAAGDAVDTEAVLGVDRAGGIKSIASEGGDGTVTRRSALMDERAPDQKHVRLISPIHWSGCAVSVYRSSGIDRRPCL